MQFEKHTTSSSSRSRKKQFFVILTEMLTVRFWEFIFLFEKKLSNDDDDDDGNSYLIDCIDFCLGLFGTTSSFDGNLLESFYNFVFCLKACGSNFTRVIPNSGLKS